METHDEEGTISLPPGPDPFEDLATRHRFVRKVVAVVASQLLIIMAIASFTMLVHDVRWFFTADETYNLTMGILVTSVLVYLLTGLWISCRPQLMKRHPVNLIFLSVITGSLAIMTSIACAIFRSEILIVTLGIVMSSFIGIFIFTFNKNCYVHSWRSLAFCILWGLMSCSSLIPLKNSEATSKFVAGGLAMIFVYAPVLHLHFLITIAPDTGMTADDYLLGALEVLSFCLCPCFCLDGISSEEDRSSPYVLVLPDTGESEVQERIRTFDQLRLPNMFLERGGYGDPAAIVPGILEEEERSLSEALISQEGDESDSQDRVAVLDSQSIREDFFNAVFIDEPSEAVPGYPGTLDDV